MTSKDRYIAGVPCWIDSSHPDPQAAAAFYGPLFGWEFEDVMPPGSPAPYLMARLAGGDVAAISSAPEGASPAWNTYVWVASADETAAAVREAGGRVLSEPQDVGPAGRMAEFADPQGAPFRVWEAREHRGAGVVNEPGSLNFNDLHTSDPAGAAAFYGAVFGWRVLDIGASMLTLPGYGDFLEARMPGMRENMAGMGAPAGFEDVVATMTPDAEAGKAHWSLTFAVDDADAVAARATELGGTVVVAPFDAAWVRMTILSDPQGVTFVASKFVPENKDVEAPAGVGAAD